LLGITVKLIRYTEDAPKLVAVASKTSLSRKPLQQVENKAIPACLRVAQAWGNTV
jgi:hypothetical protein